MKVVWLLVLLLLVSCAQEKKQDDSLLTVIQDVPKLFPDEVIKDADIVDMPTEAPNQTIVQETPAPDTPITQVPAVETPLPKAPVISPVKPPTNIPKQPASEQPLSLDITIPPPFFTSYDSAKLSSLSIVVNTDAPLKGTLSIYQYDDKTKFFRMNTSVFEAPIDISHSITLSPNLTIYMHDFDLPKTVDVRIKDLQGKLLLTKREVVNLKAPLPDTIKLSIINVTYMKPNFGRSTLESIYLQYEGYMKIFTADYLLSINGKYVMKDVVRDPIKPGIQVIHLQPNLEISDKQPKNITIDLVNTKTTIPIASVSLVLE